MDRRQKLAFVIRRGVGIPLVIFLVLAAGLRCQDVTVPATSKVTVDEIDEAAIVYINKVGPRLFEHRYFIIDYAAESKTSGKIRITDCATGYGVPITDTHIELVPGRVWVDLKGNTATVHVRRPYRISHPSG